MAILKRDRADDNEKVKGTRRRFLKRECGSFKPRLTAEGSACSKPKTWQAPTSVAPLHKERRSNLKGDMEVLGHSIKLFP